MPRSRGGPPEGFAVDKRDILSASEGWHYTMDKKKFNAIYSTYAKRLFNFILWTLHNRTFCDDILQEVFVKIWNSSTVPDNEDEIRRYVYAVARNACLDQIRKVNRFSRLRQHYTQETPLFESPDNQSHLWDSVEKLSETERSILYLHLKTGYTYKEIGVMLEIPENNIRVRAFRALKKIRSELEVVKV